MKSYAILTAIFPLLLMMLVLAGGCSVTSEQVFIPVVIYPDNAGSGPAELWGYIDQTGNLVVEPQYAQASHFSDGVATVVLYGEYQRAILGDDGDLIAVLQKEICHVQMFHSGLALANLGGRYASHHTETVVGGLWGYLNTDGQWAIAPTISMEDIPGDVDMPGYFKQGGGDFSDGRAVTPVDGGWGYRDQSGKVVIPGPFHFAFRFYKGVAEVALPDPDGGDDIEWVWINTDGHIIWP